MTYVAGVPDYDDPCACGANEWKRISYADTSLIWGFECLNCGEVSNAE